MLAVGAVFGAAAAPASVSFAAGADFSRKWTPSNTALPRTGSVQGHQVDPVAVTAPALPVPPIWQPPKAAHRPVAAGSAAVRLGGAPQAKAGEAPVAGTEAGAQGLPVALAPVAGSAVAGQTVQVEVADGRAAATAGVPGLVVTLSRAEQGGAGPVRLVVDASGLDGAFGADWAARARLVLLPGCTAKSPRAEDCRRTTPLASHYDPATKKLVADVPLPANDGAAHTAIQAAADAPAAASATVGVVSGASSGAGTYSATSLDPSQNWTAGSSSGGFAYSYPVEAPPALGGTAPKPALEYDSSSVDGRTSSTNAQASWIGDGWDYSAGFVERAYKPCAQDGIATSGDECWAGANLTMSLGGHSGQLVPDDASCRSGAPGSAEQSDCTWRLANDDGTKVQFLTGATNGTWNGSYLKVTDTAGTVFYFGLGHLPDTNGNPSTKGPDSGSAWTVPVYSPNSGDPCYDATKGKSSWCQTGWRWNLDYVVDPHGNLTTYTYAPETNYYSRGGGQNNGSGTLTQYTRGGVLQSIGYGQLLSDQIGANGGNNPAAKVAFASGERCVTSILACDPVNRTAAHAGDWPDVPMDQQCASTGTCTNYGPTFWSTKWLNSITTQVRSNGAYQDVDSYALTHQFVNVQNATENTQVPWLASVQRTGKDGRASATPVTLPPVSFTPVLLANRVDGTNLVPAPPAYNRPRIQLITTETGATLGVDYRAADCSRVNGSMPASADSDTRSCYNVKWYPPGSAAGAAPVDDWFQRYPVNSVTLNPNTPGAAPQTTAYSYGAAAWHRNDSPLTEDKTRTWDQFRGYASVTTVSGNGNDGPKSQRTATYFQGMDGDHRADGSTRSVKAAGPMSGQATDSDWLSGQTLEADTYNQAGGSLAEAVVTTGSGPVTTATHAQGSLPALVARYGSTSSVETTKSLKADGTWRTATRTTGTDPAAGNRVVSLLDSADGLPDQCTRTSYATADDPQATALPSETVTVSGASACTAAPTAANTTGWKRTLYDGKPLGRAGTAHDATGTQVVDHFDASGAAQFSTTETAGYDVYGRRTGTTDPNATDSAHPGGATTTTAYTGPAGELPTGTTVTKAAPVGAPDAATGRTTTTALDPARALTLSVTDPNGRVTTESYDAIGRLTAVWLPGRTTGQPADRTFAYTLPGVVAGKAVPPTTTTGTLLAAQGYRTSVSIMDGLGREIQTQATPGISAYTGRLITGTAYDSQGRTVRSDKEWYNGDAGPGGTLYQGTPNQVPAQTHTTYDGRGRVVGKDELAYGVVQNSTATAYPGADRTDVTPPAGTTPTSTVTDARGRTAELWQYTTAGATGNRADAAVTTYAYTADGLDATRTDAAGNVWTQVHDLRGHEVSSTDPDSGTTTQAYDADGRVATVTDARGRSVSYSYDLMGRQTGSYAGTGTTDPAAQLTARVYDTVMLDRPTSTTRYVGGASGAAYTTANVSFDTAYHPTKTVQTVPGSEIGSTTPVTYTYQASYDPITGALKADNRSAVGDVPAETLTYSYDAYGPLISFGAMGGSTYDLSSDYDAHGRNIRTTVNPWGTQIVSTTTYDESTGRTLSRFVDKQTAATGAVQQTTYAYDPSGRITAVRDIADNTPAATDLQCFGYDRLNRLTSAWTDTGALTTAPQPAVGGQGACADTSPTAAAVAPARTTVGGPSPYWQSYSYDPTGNRTGLTVHDPAGNTAADVTTTQTFGTPGRANTGSGGPHALLTATTGTATATTGYDAAGNTTAVTDATGTTGLSWNDEGKLARVDTPTRGSTDYLYDADGLQLVRHDPGLTTLNLGTDELTYNTVTRTLTGTRYYTIPNGITLVRQGGTLTYQFADPHGTNTLSLDATTLAETRRPVDPFGNLRGTPPGSWSGTRGFVGGTLDTTTGLTNLGAREYQAGTGRFLSPDPLIETTDPQQWNGYAYSNNNPVNQSDPTGKMRDTLERDDAPAPPQPGVTSWLFSLGCSNTQACTWANNGVLASGVTQGLFSPFLNISRLVALAKNLTDLAARANNTKSPKGARAMNKERLKSASESYSDDMAKAANESGKWMGRAAKGLAVAGGAMSAWSEYDGDGHNWKRAAAVGVADTAVNLAANAAGAAVGSWATGALVGTEIGVFAGPVGAVAGAVIGAAVGAGLAYLGGNAVNHLISKIHLPKIKLW